jgi:hypothetical protein
MGVTKFDTINADGLRVKLVSVLPVYPYQYYGSAANDVASSEWIGGEMVFHTGDNRIYIQQETSGIAAGVWKRLLTQLATSTTSSSSSSSSSTSSSTSTSTSTSSSTSTSTSTSSTTTP